MKAYANLHWWDYVWAFFTMIKMLSKYGYEESKRMLYQEAYELRMKLREQKAERIGYRIEDDGKSIVCLDCDMKSWNRNDVEKLYCGNCHKFHERR